MTHSRMPFVGTYRTKSGRFYFQWSFERQPSGEVRAYILHAPYVETAQSDNASDTRPFVQCGPTPNNLTDAIELAKEWAEHTEHYIVHSDEF